MYIKKGGDKNDICRKNHVIAYVMIKKRNNIPFLLKKFFLLMKPGTGFY